MPAQSAHQFEILDRPIPTVKTNRFRVKFALRSGKQHFGKIVVLGFAVRVFIEHAIINGSAPRAVRPEQSNQIDAGDNRFLLVRPMPVNQNINSEYGYSNVESSRTRMPRCKSICVWASRQSVSASGSRRNNKRVKASCAGASRLSGCTRSASVAVTSRGVAVIKLM